MAGKPKYKWNTEQAKIAETCAGLGLKDVNIATILKMSRATMCRLYAKELANGRAVALQNVAKTAYQMAISGKVPAMTMFWLKCQGEWREVQRVEHSGPEGKPMEVQAAPTLSRDQIRQAAKELADESD